jgi:hypothetical protein
VVDLSQKPLLVEEVIWGCGRALIMGVADELAS